MNKNFAIFTLIAASCFAAAQKRSTDSGESSGTSVLKPRASLLISGNVQVNQRAETELASTLFSGDEIQTSAGAAARISAPGLSAYLPGNSCLKYRGDQLELCNCGSIDINALTPVSVTYAGKELVVSARGSDSAFHVSVAGRNLQISISRGSAEISRSGSILAKVASGSSKSFAGLGCAPAASVVSPVTARAATLSAPAAIYAAVIKASHPSPVSSTIP